MAKTKKKLTRTDKYIYAAAGTAAAGLLGVIIISTRARKMWDFGPPARVPYTITGGWWDSRAYRNGVHFGVDLDLPNKTPIYAVGDGKIVRVQRTPSSNAGRYVSIMHDGGLRSDYFHLSSVPANIKIGDSVGIGDLIGYSGTSGAGGDGSFAAHLHFQFVATGVLTTAYFTTRFGKPTTGFGKTYGQYAIPAEPLLPASAYRASVVTNSKAHKVPLYATLHNIPYVTRTRTPT